LNLPEDLSQFQALTAIIARLRGPGGCPWDRQQTHVSLRANLLSECYEALEALDAGDAAKLREELGDLLLQIVLHAQIAADTGEFAIGDVIRGITEKLIRRHPHIFGSARAADADAVMHNWETLKREERGGDASMLASVPRDMPALAYAYEVQRRVARVGFDWADTEGVIDKLVEEVKELRAARDTSERAGEYGDLLFTLANVMRRDGIDPEAALRRANGKFLRRFAGMETLCRQRGQDFHALSFEAQNALWEEVKGEED